MFKILQRGLGFKVWIDVAKIECFLFYSLCHAVTLKNHFRLLHQKLSFWAAKRECKALGGQLLLLQNTQEVKRALTDSFIGNVESDYRIDGWSNGVWLEGPSKDNGSEIMFQEDQTFMDAMMSKTLSISLDEWSVHSARHVDARVGAICQSEDQGGEPGCKEGNST